MTPEAAREAIIAIVHAIDTDDLPRWREDGSGCLWFSELSMGWNSMSHPELTASSQISTMLAAESAAREFARRRDAEAAA